MHLQFVYDYRSPYAYLANTQLASLNHPVEYCAVDIVAVMKKVNNQPSPACPAKSRYSGVDAGRWAALYQVPLKPNSRLFKALRSQEFDGSLFSRAGIAAQLLGAFEVVHPTLFEAIWAGDDDLLSVDGRKAFLERLGVEVDIWQIADSAPVREQLAEANDEAASRGVFGVPTFFCGDEQFFGNDRLDFVRAALKSAQEA
ncbi:2-hydroxychromene-2-carboxylate isomerase [Pseudomonas sp. YH-1]|uniref:2-hydroxychromene-2-carboxylate isomerase n=1 Tax=Pseudomonas sp. YH-1 TaxID=3384787 RepID=UPI003F7CFCE2